MKKLTNNIPFKSKLERYKDIEKRNKTFDELTNEEKRKEIAYEGLKMVMKGTLKASWGCYWDGDLHNIADDCRDSKQLQEKLLNIPKSLNCQVCQRGLMMISQIRLNNNISPSTNDKENGAIGIIKGFRFRDFQNMEKEFERNYYSHPYSNNTNEKLANICCNVIQNGNFSVEDKRDFLTIWNIEL
jgi:hypothetical protein